MMTFFQAGQEKGLPVPSQHYRPEPTQQNNMEVKVEDRLDLSHVSEEEICGLPVYNVLDSQCPPVTPNRAEKSLPKNLILKPTNALPDSSIIGVWAQEYIPKGTRFGPMEGEIYPQNAVPSSVDRKYFWRVYNIAT